MKRSEIQETICFIIPYQNWSCMQEGQTVHEGRFSENLVINLKITCTNSNIICCISCTQQFFFFCFALYLKGIFLLSNNLFSFSHFSFFTFILLFCFCFIRDKSEVMSLSITYHYMIIYTPVLRNLDFEKWSQ